MYSLDDVNDLYALLRQLSRQVPVDEALCEKLWRGGVAEQPKGQLQLEWCEEWASQAIHYQHWNQLNKAALALKQGTPQGSDEWRKYSFWLIVAQWLASQPRTDSVQHDKRDEKREMMVSEMMSKLAIRQLQEALATAEKSTQEVVVVYAECRTSTDMFVREALHQATNYRSKKYPSSSYCFTFCESRRNTTMSSVQWPAPNPSRLQTMTTISLWLFTKLFQQQKVVQNLLRGSRTS